MADKSKYLQWLEGLKALYEQSRSFTPMGQRLACINLIVETIEVKKRFLNLLEVLDEKIVLDADVDVDYECWCKRSWWPPVPTSIPLIKGLDTNSTIITKTEANILTNYTNMGAPCPVYSQLVSAFENIGSDTLDITANFGIGAEKVLGELCDTLSLVNIKLNEGHPDEFFENLFNDLYEGYFSYSDNRIDVQKEYDNWKIHEVYDPINVDILVEYRYDVIADLLKSKLIDHIKGRAKTSDENRFGEEIDFVYLGEDKITIINRYAKLRKLVDYENKVYYLSEKKIGHHICECRNKVNEEDRKNFFKSLYKLKLIQEDLIRLIGNQDRIELPSGFNPDKSIFHENFDSARIYRRLIRFEKEDCPIKKQIHWYVVYKFFESDGWLIDKTQTHFLGELELIMGRNVAKQEDFKKVNKFYIENEIDNWGTYSALRGSKAYTKIASELKKVFVRDFFLKPGKKDPNKKRVKL